MIHYTPEEKRRAKKLASILFCADMEKPEKLYSTTWGTKTNTGIINTILTVMCGDEEVEKEA